MTAWMVLAVWVCGWAVGTRLALTHLMTRVRCGKGSTEFLSTCRDYHGSKCARPVGASRDRTLTDQLAALGIGLAWPVLIAARLMAGTVPLTGPEKDRLLREQQQRIDEQATQIDRLHRQIGRP